MAVGIGGFGAAISTSCCVFQLVFVVAAIIGLWMLSKFLRSRSAPPAGPVIRDSDGSEPIATLRWYD